MKYGCGDCGIKEGELHKVDCDQERCVKCDRQLLSCPKHSWEDFKDEEREPFFNERGFSCERCNCFIPNIFIVSDKQWTDLCGVTFKQNCVLCILCAKFIAKVRGIKLEYREC